jgi:FKBP-type peptidyl-prolyl cis-trans isomerase
MNPKKSLVLCSVFMLLFGLASTACAQQEGEEPEAAATAEGETAAAGEGSDREKASYAIGLNMGRNFSSQEVDVDLDALISGLRAGLSEADPAYTDEELQAAMQAFQQQVMAEQEARRARQATENVAAGEAFLTENAAREGVQVTESGLHFEVVEPGTGESPSAEDSVQVHYKGALIDGTVFDSSYERGQPATFPLAGVIPGFREGIQMMQVGGKYKLYIPPALGYGERGAGTEIPPNSTLVFEIELLDVNPAAATPPQGQGQGQGAQPPGGQGGGN